MHTVSSVSWTGELLKNKEEVHSISLFFVFLDWKFPHTNSDFPDVKKIGWFFSCFIPYEIRHITAVKKKVKTGGKNMNDTILDVYSESLTDTEMESLFSTPKESRKGDRRKTDYKKAKRKARINIATMACNTVPLYDNLHQYSKNKIHCSCRLCRGKDYFGRHILTKQEKNRYNEMLVELQELEGDMPAKVRKEIA